MMTQIQYLDFDGLQKYHQNIKKHFAPLDNNGLVPAANLPSYVDDVLEYGTLSEFPTTGETGKIYVALDTNLTYRWSGTHYVEISSSLALGETASTAFSGYRGVVLETKTEKLENITDSLPSDIIDGVESEHNGDTFSITFTCSQKDKDGVYQNGTSTQTTIPVATTEECGLMSKADKTTVDSYSQIKNVLGNAADSFVDDGRIVRMDLWNILYTDSNVKLHTEYDTISKDERSHDTLDFTINAATSEKAGVMSVADKKKLDSLSTNTSNIIFFDDYVESATVSKTDPSTFTSSAKVVYVADKNTFAVYDNGIYYVGTEAVKGITFLKLYNYGKVSLVSNAWKPFTNTFYISIKDFTMYVSDNGDMNILHIINTKDITSQQINSL